MKYRILTILFLVFIWGCEQKSKKITQNKSNIVEAKFNAFSTKNDSTTTFYYGIINGDTLKVIGKNNNIDNEINPLNSRTNFRNPEVRIKNTLLKLNDSYELDIVKTKLINITNERSHLCLFHYHPFDSDQLLVITFNNDSVIKQQFIIAGEYSDLDSDGKIEIGGFSTIEAPCLDCDSSYYQFAKYWEFDTQIKFDTALSIKVTKERFGVYLGFSKDTVLFDKTISKNYR